MNDFVIILILVFPSVLLAILWWSTTKKERENQSKIELLKLQTEKLKTTSSLKISAYERLIAMMERFKLFGLVMRNNEGIGSSQLQLELINAVRSEFEMNVSMQMYISDLAWKQVNKGKDQTIESIKKAGIVSGVDATAIKLKQEIFKEEDRHKNTELQKAIDILKKEVKSGVLNG